MSNTETILATAYELGRKRGQRLADDSHLWGGRITRQGQAEATARAYIKATEDGDELDWIGDQPFPYDLESDTLKAVRHELGGSAVLAWMTSENLDEDKASDITAQEWMMGYTDGICQTLLDSARSYLANL